MDAGRGDGMADGAVGAEADVFDHEIDIGDGKARIEQDEAEQLNSTLCASVPETPRKVGSTPSITQGWRPYSATIQPSSAANHGSGRLHSAAHRNKRYLSSRRVALK